MIDKLTMVIALTKGMWAIVDVADYEIVKRYKWHAHKGRGKVFYAARCITINGHRQTIHMHRVILDIADPNLYADHIDGNGLNNRRNNIRVCTNSQNQANATKRKDGITSRYRGVSWNAPTNKWRAQTHINGKVVSLGYFLIEEDAARAYDAALRDRAGEFARTNLPRLAEKP